MIERFELPAYFAQLATVLWAISGALVAMRRDLDVVGVCAIALAAAAGGGLLRDGLFLQRTPWLIQDPVALPMILASALAVVLLHPFLRARVAERAIALADAVAAPAFSVVGLTESVAAGVPLPGAFLVGVITGVGGGVIRDLLVGEVPVIFQPGQYYALLVALASVLYLALVLPLGVDASTAAFAAIGAAFVLRLLTLRHDWRTVPAAELGARIARIARRRSRGRDA
jgi:uncharacterized membrane protein YeiH